LPGVAMVTSSDPLMAFDPDHAPEAAQDVALVEDQVKVTIESNKTEEDEEERLAVGVGSVGVGLPPPPPPPHDDIKNIIKIPKHVFFVTIKLIYQKNFKK
jgi:hypothetical protein